ncbi:methylenetetrahydrofolate--tRNA-(uracil(54)-C(5))-methyltransferase (FADH(2)-oxidizing) TrmFO [Desulfogranum mediterraneum]|uniref:methylenetetrahydrofolate--tRNA-(uracil(54)- C(5))-methyltransferase (FADH(2)-oxidizing) TrmFO n=1 Tax=Desulfogranum mediterraneum TaxID=160661 RepID=UPI00040E05F8|nr:methylenetetrahydrofolate--tRNA-(uracil(54)-C(5))-methyltransferase (FADH(2)-oxidizing) TrmFO [Desulfogranum mediterraneum]
MKDNTTITIIGGGLAGCEAAWQAAARGASVVLYEMKPHRFSPAHESEALAELVCSNSLRADGLNSAVGLLKEEMRRLDSLVMEAAAATAVPAGKALAVDRQGFAAHITRALEAHPAIEIRRQEVTSLPQASEQAPVILATGPLTSAAMAEELQRISKDNLAFYDAIAPIIDADSLDRAKIYRKSRWDDDTPGDYLNCPLSEEEYTAFLARLMAAPTVPLKDFEEAKYFEGCLPIEVMAARGPETLRFGPMKPVGLAHPESGEMPHAVIQLRAENREETSYNMVGFQTKLSYGAQQEVFRTIPGLEQAEFLRLGSIHRNTFICAPKLLDPSLQLLERPGLFIAGQLSGVEGYVESAAMGLLAGINTAALALGGAPTPPPPAATALGALVRHLTASDAGHFQPSNVNFGLFPPLRQKMRKKERGPFRAKLALELLESWQESLSARG